MSYFLFPEIHHKIDNINIISDTESVSNCKLYLSLTLNDYLNNIKKQIDDNCDNWDHIKRYTNPYEFIHTTIPGEGREYPLAITNHQEFKKAKHQN